MRCGYNLRGLARDANCPECGSAIGESFATAPLPLSDPSWLRRARIGVIILAIGLIGWVAMPRRPVVFFSGNPDERISWALLMSVSVRLITLRAPSTARSRGQLLMGLVLLHLILAMLMMRRDRGDWFVD
jgi:hypothetical protein